MRKPDLEDFVDFIAGQISVPSGDRRGEIIAGVDSERDDTLIVEVIHLDWEKNVDFEVTVRKISEDEESDDE